MLLDELRRWYAYNEWATSRLLAVAVDVPEEAQTRELGTSFGTLRATLAHMLGAEWLWLERCHGRSAHPSTLLAQVRDVRDMAEQWREVTRGQHAFLDDLDDEALAVPLSYVNLAGEPRVYSLGDVLRHVVNHATYHRGQVAAALRQLGVAPPSTDFTAFLDEAARSLAPDVDASPV